MVKLVKSRDEAFAPLRYVTLRHPDVEPEAWWSLKQNVTYLRHSTLYVKTGKNMWRLVKYVS